MLVQFINKLTDISRYDAIITWLNGFVFIDKLSRFSPLQNKKIKFWIYFGNFFRFPIAIKDERAIVFVSDPSLSFDI